MTAANEQSTRLRQGKRLSPLQGLVAVVALIGATGALVYMTGGTKYAYLHLMYLPVILAAYLWEKPGGGAAGLVAGLVLGPLMPVDTETGLTQTAFSWGLRMTMFTAVGLAAGQAQSLLSQRLRAVERAMAELSDSHVRFLTTFARAVSLRDEPTGGHCERVAQNAAALGQAMGLADRSLTDLYWAGMLHDLGKLSVPERILLKPGRLTPEEYAVVKQHSDKGADMLQSVSADLALIAGGVRAHHERWDGTGYPRGLKGEAIPLYGRILAIVDVFEALTCQRPYREPMSPQAAVTYLHEHAGTHFDPAILAVFVQLFSEGKISVSVTASEQAI